MIVTHRPATVEIADTVVVVEDGRIIECGPRAEVAASGGRLTQFMRRWREVEAWQVGRGS